MSFETWIRLLEGVWVVGILGVVFFVSYRIRNRNRSEDESRL